MPSITTVQKIDSVGRVVIPKHIREKLDLQYGDLVKITVEKENAGGEL